MQYGESSFAILSSWNRVCKFCLGVEALQATIDESNAAAPYLSPLKNKQQNDAKRNLNVKRTKEKGNICSKVMMRITTLYCFKIQAAHMLFRCICVLLEISPPVSSLRPSFCRT
mmetsp:Transcript_15964/g.30897  ORF Transcript_15964/g.30897 Transcript_15964/m.30897 type:complete len:114 (-) Transcript_15964:242-583(-)